MGRKSLYPKGKQVVTNIRLNEDFAEHQKELVQDVLKPFYLLKGETESEYIQRIQSMHLEKCSNEALIDLKSKKNGK